MSLKKEHWYTGILHEGEGVGMMNKTLDPLVVHKFLTNGSIRRLNDYSIMFTANKLE